MTRVESLSEKDSRNRLGSKDRRNEVMRRFYTLVDRNEFYETAELILSQVDNPEQLAECARIVEQREPGSTFYRGMFWSKIARSFEVSGDNNKRRREFLEFCRLAEIHPTRANTYIACGKAIECVENPSPLREAPKTLFENAQRQKERTSEYLIEAASILKENPAANPSQIHKNWCKQNGSIKSNLDIIKPSDWWAFSHPKWRKSEDFSGSIPGEIYANTLFYFAPQLGVAVDPMAGSGMLKRVYEDRDLWQKGSDFNLEIQLFDLNPRFDFIKKHDSRMPLPIKADWIFLDPPYFGQSSDLFEDEFALSTDYEHYLSLLRQVVVAMAESLNPDGRLCILLPKWSGLRPNDPNSNIPSDAHSFAVETGLRWLDTAFVSRGRQQKPGSAIQNIVAKRDRRMRSDTCVLNVFEKRGS